MTLSCFYVRSLCVLFMYNYTAWYVVYVTENIRTVRGADLGMACAGPGWSRWLGRSANSIRSYTTRPKFYKEKPKYYKDVAYAYAKFRREVSELRKGFREEWLEQQRMTQTQFSSKAAEEARQKEMEETRAFEAAARELERMSKNRCISN